MIPKQFDHFLESLEKLTDKQRRYIEKVLKGNGPVEQIIKALEQRLIDSPECPCCHSASINRHGKVHKMQRYRCKNCGKTFVATTGTPFERLHHKERWLDYFRCMLEGKALRPSAKECGINLKTAFNWRHRFLALPALLKASHLEGIIEADETLFAYSEKGSKQLERKPRKRGMKAKKRGRSSEDWVQVLTVRDRGQHTFETILPHLTTDHLTKELGGKVEKDSVLCTDGYRPYIKFSENHDLIHKRLNISAGVKVIDKVFHIQNVNAYHSRLKSWIKRFHGVATKYLENYLGWFRYLDTSENLNKYSMFQTQQQPIGT